MVSRLQSQQPCFGHDLTSTALNGYADGLLGANQLTADVIERLLG